MKKIYILVTVLLFIIPFFWLKPGFMDLGGDSSRLYFFDPVAYLRNYSLFAVSPSGFGGENIGFMTIPLVAVFAAMRRVMSATTLISMFHGLSLSVGFLFVYLSIVQLLRVEEKNNQWKDLAALAGGLLYLFSPVSIYGWDKALMTHNHVFLNPLLFYLLLQYMITDRTLYLFFALTTTFVFSANFSFVAAPVFFAFYPLTLIFMVWYKSRILGERVRWMHFFWAGCAFVLLQAFHILPQVASMLSSGSVLYSAVFSKVGKFDRGLGYFSAIAPSIKASVNIFMVPQMGKTPWYLTFMVFLPFTLMFGLLWSRASNVRYRKTLALACTVFLVIFFFATANITDAGLSLYKKLFMVPGFSIYRNFYGQWASAFFFYYALLFGLTLAVTLQTAKKLRVVFTIFVVAIFVNAWPFINGSLVNPILWKSSNSRIAMNMDPSFVQAIEYMRSLPKEGKVLTLPLTDPGYQIVAGKDGGAYQGPSMISYLSGKQDFAGALELGRFGLIFLESVRNGNGYMIKKILGLLNIRYIFYDNDPRVYDDFPAFPYDDVRKYFPGNQEGYEAFVRSLSLSLKQSFGNRFFIYELDDDSVTPRIYPADRAYAISQSTTDPIRPILQESDGSTSVFFEGVAMDLGDERWYPMEGQNITSRMLKNPDPPRIMHHAFAKIPTSSVLYPFITLKEMWSLYKADKAGYFSAIDNRNFLSAKRVLEIEQWGADMPIHKTISSILDFTSTDIVSESLVNASLMMNFQSWKHLNSWEAELLRYYQYFDQSIRLIEEAPETILWKAEQKFIVSEYLRQHQRRIIETIRSHSSLSVHREYLLRVTGILFADLFKRTWNDISDMSMSYTVSIPSTSGVEYEVYIDSESLDAGEVVSFSDGVGQYRRSGKGRWERLGSIVRTHIDTSVSMRARFIEQKNLISNHARVTVDESFPDVFDGDVGLDMRYVKGSQGAVWKIDGWKAKSYYVLRFKYRTAGDPFSVRVLEADVKSNSVISPSVLVDDLLLSDEWTEYQAVIRSDVFANMGFVQVMPAANQQSISRIQMENVSLVRMPHPSVMLVQKNLQPAGRRPTVSFVYRDPTSYTVQIHDARSPYFLVLNEDVNPRWRLALVPNAVAQSDASEGIYPLVSNFIDRMVPRQRKIIASDRHYQANIYANAWYIRPEDVDGQSDYELELYMGTQSYFYAGAAISVVAFVGLMLFALRTYLIKRLQT